MCITCVTRFAERGRCWSTANTCCWQGRGADLFLSEQPGLEHVSNDWYDTPLRRRQWAAQQQQPETVLLEPGGVEKKFGTVGAVALDQHGHVAAATSTGGITNKRFRGRVGDSPLIGSGTWADDRSAAISATGHGGVLYAHRGCSQYCVAHSPGWLQPARCLRPSGAG